MKIFLFRFQIRSIHLLVSYLFYDLSFLDHDLFLEKTEVFSSKCKKQ